MIFYRYWIEKYFGKIDVSNFDAKHDLKKFASSRKFAGRKRIKDNQISICWESGQYVKKYEFQGDFLDRSLFDVGNQYYQLFDGGFGIGPSKKYQSCCQIPECEEVIVEICIKSNDEGKLNLFFMEYESFGQKRRFNTSKRVFVKKGEHSYFLKYDCHLSGCYKLALKHYDMGCCIFGITITFIKDDLYE